MVENPHDLSEACRDNHPLRLALREATDEPLIADRVGARRAAD